LGVALTGSAESARRVLGLLDVLVPGVLDPGLSQPRGGQFLLVLVAGYRLGLIG
jgi:hypothetical protein